MICPCQQYQAQIYKGSAFNIDRLQGKSPGTVIFRFTGPFTARDVFGSLTPIAVRNLFEGDLTPGDAPLITKNIFDITGVPYMDSTGLACLSVSMSGAMAKASGLLPPGRAHASFNCSI